MEMARMFAYIAFVVAIAALLNGIVSYLEARGRRRMTQPDDFGHYLSAGIPASCRLGVVVAAPDRLGDRRALVRRSAVHRPPSRVFAVARHGVGTDGVPAALRLTFSSSPSPSPSRS